MSPSMLVALLALFVALSGTAVAAGIVPLAQRALVADNAKKLGGKTAAQIAATPSPAMNGPQIAAMPSPASTAAGLVVVKTGTWSLSPRQEGTFTVTCDSGQRAIAGGWSDPGDYSTGYQTLPTADGTGWATTIYTSTYATAPQSGTLYAVCLK